MLVFKPRHADQEWTAASRFMTLIVRKTDGGFAAFLHKWSDGTRSPVAESVAGQDGSLLFRTREQAEAACQKRYEQELRWMHRGAI